MSLERIFALVVKEWREVLRDKLFLTLSFFVPAFQMIVFGYGLVFDVENIPFALLDYDKSSMSREYSRRFIDSPYFDFKGEVSREEEISELLASSKIRLGIIIPPKFEERLLSERPVEVQHLIDGVFPFRASTTKGYVVAINGDFNADLLSKHLAKKLGMPKERAEAMAQPVKAQVRYLYNQELKSTWSVSALMIMFVLMTCPPFLTAMGVAKEKETGSIYNIYSSPIRKTEFLIGKLTPYVAISGLNSVALWVIAVRLFDAPFKGDPLFFFLSSLVYVTCTTGIGLVVSLLVQTQIAALMITVVLTVVPAVLYSGLTVPIASMEPVGQFQAHLFPAMYYTFITVGSFLKGIGISGLWDNLVALLVYAMVLWVIGYLLFRKRVNY